MICYLNSHLSHIYCRLSPSLLVSCPDPRLAGRGSGDETTSLLALAFYHTLTHVTLPLSFTPFHLSLSIPSFTVLSPPPPPFPGQHSKTALVLVGMVIPGSATFLLFIFLVNAGHTTLSAMFFVGYLICAVLQVRLE